MLSCACFCFDIQHARPNVPCFHNHHRLFHVKQHYLYSCFVACHGPVPPRLSKSCKNSFSCHFKGQIQITMKFCTCIACNTVCEYKRLSWSKAYLNYGIQKLWYILDFKKKSFCEAAPWIHSLSQNNFRLLCLVSLKLQHYGLCKCMQMGVIIKCLYQACPVCGLYHANISLHKLFNWRSSFYWCACIYIESNYLMWRGLFFLLLKRDLNVSILFYVTR